jgi:hypothetical protein
VKTSDLTQEALVRLLFFKKQAISLTERKKERKKESKKERIQSASK